MDWLLFMFGKNKRACLKYNLAFFLGLSLFVLCGCDKQPLNSPHKLKDYAENTRFGSFVESPKTLDPAQAYSVDETTIISQIYEPSYQYHYLKRPYLLIPLTAASMPLLRYWNIQGQEVAANAKDIAFTSYDIQIKPQIYYQPHPAFAKDSQGNFQFLSIQAKKIRQINELNQFGFAASRELTAEDYVYEIKRLAHPAINSPILGIMEEHILGMKDYAKTLRAAYDQYKSQKKVGEFFDLRKYPLPGVSVIDKYTYRIIVKGQFPQLKYWLATWFFSPLPWEADYFYTVMQEHNNILNLNWYPIGTGPYMLAANDPNKQMVLVQNPNFHPEYFPMEGSANDQKMGYLDNAGKRLPFVNKFIFSLEKESIPRWNKFLQGYYDQSTIATDNFNEAVQVDAQGKLRLTPLMKEKRLRLTTEVEPSIYYYAFNMDDPLVGGYSESARKLRQAIAIAINMEDFIHIFLNDRGIAAQGPIPPTIFGYIPGKPGINPYVYDANGKRKSIKEAKALLTAAGYPDGRNAKTGKPLIIRLDAVSNSPSDKEQFEWMSAQFAKLGIELNIETSDYNRFQEKLHRGDVQFYGLAWAADYPDPENFLFLFYGPNSSSKFDGVNYTNYSNKAYDDLFQQMKNMPDTIERQAIIQKMVALLQADNVWVWGVFPKVFYLSQSWLMPIKPNAIAQNTLKYQRVIPQRRYQLIRQWNPPLFWPLALIFIVIFSVLIPAGLGYWIKVHKPARQQLQFKKG